MKWPYANSGRPFFLGFSSLLSALPARRRQVLALVPLCVLAAGRGAETEGTNQPAGPMKLSLEDLVKVEVPKVYGASKREEPSTEAPASVTVIQADEIQKYGWRTLADLLRSVQSFDVTYDRNYDFLGVRGFNRGDYNSRVLLLVDGHRLNNGLSDGAYIDTAFLLDVDLIHRVEVIRGPGSVLYGNNAMFGVINVVTRRGADIHGVEVSGWGGSQDTGRGRITIGNKFTNDVEFLISGSLYESQGGDRLFFKPFNSPAFNHGLAVNGDDDQFKSLFGSVGYHDFTLEGGFIRREKGNPTAPDADTNPADPRYPYAAAFNDPRTRTIDERGYASLKFVHQLPKEVDLTAQVYYDRSDLDRANVYKDPLYVLDAIHTVQTAEWWGAELQANKTLWERHILTIGGEYRDDFNQREHTLDGATGRVSPDIQRDRHSYGIYFQGDIALLANLHFNAGVRYDQYGAFHPTANPRLALIYHPWPATTLKAIYGTAFRAPNFYELIAKSPSRGLTPETITTYQLVWEQTIVSHLRSSVAGFYNQMDDLISWQPDPAGGTSYQNVKGAEARGVEFALQTFGWESGIQGRASYTLQTTRDRATDQILTDSPEHLFKLNLSVPVFHEKLIASAEFQYTSQRATLLGTEAGGFGVVNLTLLSRNLAKGLDLSVSVYNVLDRRYADPATPFHVQDVIPQDGRLVLGKLTYRF